MKCLSSPFFLKSWHTKLWYLIRDVLSRLRWPQLFQQISYYRLQNAIISSEKTVHVMRYQKFLTAVLLLLEEKKTQEGKKAKPGYRWSGLFIQKPPCGCFGLCHSSPSCAQCNLSAITHRAGKACKSESRPLLLQPTCFKWHNVDLETK